MITAIIQARIGSSRLPGKMFAKIEEKPLLWHVIERVKNSKKIDKIILATTKSPKDKALLNIAKDCNIGTFAGDKENVLNRFYTAARKFKADIIVRITADDPFKDPQIIDKCISVFLKSKNIDYVSNTIEPTYPEGLDIEVFSFNALEKAWKEAKTNADKEHVTPYIWRNKQLFKVKNFCNNKNLSNLRWTIDYQKDLDFAREVYKNIYPGKKIFLMNDILNLLEKKPELSKINQGIIRNEGYLKSLKHGK